jgi:hypothetical protein
LVCTLRQPCRENFPTPPFRIQKSFKACKFLLDFTFAPDVKIRPRRSFEQNGTPKETRHHCGV